MPKPKFLDAPSLLERLRSDAAAKTLAQETGLSAGAIEEARELLLDLPGAPLDALAALPAPLLAALLEAPVAERDPALLQRIAVEGPKELAKAAKKNLHRLKDMGVSLPAEKAPEETAPASLPAAPPEEPPCLVSSPDASGDRAVWVPRFLRGGGVEIAMVVLNDLEGVLEAGRLEVNRRGFRSFKSELARRAGGIAVREASRAKGLGLVAAALERSRFRGRHIAEENMLLALGGRPQDAAPVSASDPPLPDDEEREALQAGGSLFDQQQEMRGWIPPVELLQTLALKVQEIQTSSLYLDEAQKLRQIEVELAKAAEEYFTEERRAAYAGRVFEMADLFRESGREPAARAAAATARALRGATSVSAIPFARTLFTRAFPAQPSGEGMPEGPPKPPEGGHIVLPDSPE